jgi:hypothetical protein
MTEPTDSYTDALHQSPVIQDKFYELIAQKLVRDHGMDPQWAEDFLRLSREQRGTCRSPSRASMPC